MSIVIKAKELSCFYGIVLGLNNVSFEINSGITGLVGPNGAGKSTLIKLMTGQISPSSGLLEVYGQTPRNNAKLLRKIGYCPEHEHLHKELKPVDWLRTLATLSGMPWRETKASSQKALERVGLGAKHWSKRIGNYSKGMKQRVKLAQAIIHDPELIILDEPMNGLDPMGRQEITDILRKLESEGTDVFISSHILHELETLCSNFLMLNWGRALASGPQSEITGSEQHRSEQAVIRSSNPNAVAACLNQAKQLRGYLIEGDALIIWLQDPSIFYKNWPSYLSDCAAEIFEVRNQTKSLSSIFERMTQQ